MVLLVLQDDFDAFLDDVAHLVPDEGNLVPTSRQRKKEDGDKVRSIPLGQSGVPFPGVCACLGVFRARCLPLSLSLSLSLSVLSLCSRPVKALSRLSVRLSESIQAKRVIFVRTSSLFVSSMIVR